MRFTFLLALTALCAIQSTRGLPTRIDGQPAPVSDSAQALGTATNTADEQPLPPAPIEKIPNDLVLSNILRYLPKEDSDSYVQSSRRTQEGLKNQLRYDPVLSVLGSPENFVQSHNLPAYPHDDEYYHLYVCDDTLEALEAINPSPISSALKTLHVKFCGVNENDGNIDRLVIDKFVKLTPIYHHVTDFKVFGPTGELLVEHLYNYLAVSPDNYGILDQVMAKKGFDINERYSHYGRTMLFEAVEMGNINLAELLIGRGADVNAADIDGWKPLYYALLNGGNLEMFNILLQSGADVNATTNIGRTPLYYAVSWGNLEMVNILLQRGAHVNAADEDGTRPIDLAIENDYQDIVQALIKAGADYNADVEGATNPMTEESSLNVNH